MWATAREQETAREREEREWEERKQRVDGQLQFAKQMMKLTLQEFIHFKMEGAKWPFPTKEELKSKWEKQTNEYEEKAERLERELEGMLEAERTAEKKREAELREKAEQVIAEKKRLENERVEEERRRRAERVEDARERAEARDPLMPGVDYPPPIDASASGAAPLRA